MIIKKILPLCTKHKRVVILKDDDGRQWLGNAQAQYLLPELPEFNEATFCDLFDISEKKENELAFSIGEPIPAGFNISDAVTEEIHCERVGDIQFYWNGELLLPYKTSEGVVYINKAHFLPLDGAIDDFFVFERISEGGTLYFVIKSGFMVVAFCLPYGKVDKKFAEQLQTISRLTKMKIENMAETGADLS